MTHVVPLTSDSEPTLDALLAAIDAMGPALDARAVEAEVQRMIPHETMEALFGSGVLRFFVPRRFGGYEFDWGAQIEIGRKLARHCASTAWIACVVGSHGAYIGRMSPEAQADVWANGPDVLISTGSVSRNTRVEPVEGGVRVSGHWSFCSGIDHASWVLLRASPTNDHQQTYYLFPRSDVTIKDDWFVSGMSGTGSKSAVIENAFVPEHRALPLRTMMAPRPPGSRVNRSPVHTASFKPFGGTNLLGPLVGGAEAVLASYRDLVRAGVGGLSSEDPQVQLRLAESEAEMGAAICLLDSLIQRQRDAAATDADLDHDARIALVRDRVYSARLCINAAERLITSLDTHAVLGEHPIQRHFRDLCGMIQQIGVNWDRNMTDMVKSLFGRPTDIQHLNAL